VLVLVLVPVLPPAAAGDADVAEHRLAWQMKVAI
jgi:hypothetical protein